jgi:copper homeostasis protein
MARSLEIACFNTESAIIAAEAGADRIELCDDFSAGGITPNYESYEVVRKTISKTIFVMIRPRGGDFTYTENEFEQMQSDIQYFKARQVDGFVFGILNEDLSINEIQNKLLVQLAHPLPCSFHRAFDRSGDFVSNLKAVIDCGFKTILTSGSKSSAIDGLLQLKELIRLSESKIEIMPGGGVRSSNIALLKENLDTVYFHTSAILQEDMADTNEIKLIKKILHD